jgi:trigger factor
MTIECNEIEYCKLKVNYSADPSVVAEKQKEAINQLRTLPVPGFRPGKANDDAIKRKYKGKISEWVKREMISHAYDDILFETKIQPIGFPQTLDLHFDGTNFSCELLFLKKPEFELQDIKNIQIPTPHQPQTVAEIAEELIQSYRLKLGDARPYEENDFVQVGDKITVDVDVQLDGQVVESLSKQGMLYEVGTNYVDGFDDNILGMGAGEERSFETKLTSNVLPTQFNKNAIVKVVVHMGMRQVPCALDDDFAKKLNYDTYDALYKAVDGVASVQFKNKQEQLVAEQVKKILVNNHSFELPSWLVTMEAQEIAQRNSVKWDDAADDVKQVFTSRASDNVKFALILDSVRKIEPEAELSDSEAMEYLKQKLLNMGSKDPSSYLMKAQKTGQLIGMIASVRNEYALQWIVNNVKLVE